MTVTFALVFWGLLFAFSVGFWFGYAVNEGAQSTNPAQEFSALLIRWGMGAIVLVSGSVSCTLLFT